MVGVVVFGCLARIGAENGGSPCLECVACQDSSHFKRVAAGIRISYKVHSYSVTPSFLLNTFLDLFIQRVLLDVRSCLVNQPSLRETTTRIYGGSAKTCLGLFAACPIYASALLKNVHML